MLSKIRFALRHPRFTFKFIERELSRRWRKSISKPSHRPKPYGGSPLPTHFFDDADFSAFKDTRAADAILAGELCIYGLREFSAGKQIDWHKDYLSDFSWPSDVFGHDIVYKYPVGTDIKNPWEVSRAHHLTTVGLAYRATKDEKYAAYVANTIRDWIEHNPFYLGVNWKVAMEVGIRASNWLLAYDLISESQAAQETQFKRIFLGSLAEHGKYIMENLEYFGVKSNHYMSDLIGLVWIGTLCPSLPHAKKWLQHGLDELDIEILHQFHPDGLNFEASIAYHRLVLELVGYTDLLTQRHRQQAISPEARERLQKAFTSTAALLKPNGQGPQFGDNDTGRFFIFSNYHHWQAMDLSYLLDLGRLCFPELSGSSSQELGWLLPNYSKKAEKPLSDAYFPNGGQLVARRDKWQLNLHLAGIGQDGNGGHNHDDAGSLELTYGDANVLVDPGTGVYTSNPELRNTFRSSSLHNAPIVAGQAHQPSKLLFVGGAFTVATLEQNDIKAGQWTVNLAAENYLCTRVINLGSEGLSVTDAAIKPEGGPVQTLLTFDPSLKVIPHKQGFQIGEKLLLTTSAKATLKKSQYSPAYATIVETDALLIEGGAEATFAISAL